MPDPREVHAYWAELRHQDAPIGAAFFLASEHLITARHCLTQNDLGVGAALDVVSDGAVLKGEVAEVSPDVDLAVIRVALPEGDVVSRALKPVSPARDRSWRAPYSPLEPETRLHGKIREVDVRVRCDGGGQLRGLQLFAEENLGSYDGFSGNPVEVERPTVGPAGILIRQLMDRQDTDRASQVLHAAHIKEPLDRFAVFRISPADGSTSSETVTDTEIQTMIESEELQEALRRMLRRRVDDGLWSAETLPQIATMLEGL